MSEHGDEPLMLAIPSQRAKATGHTAGQEVDRVPVLDWKLGKYGIEHANAGDVVMSVDLTRGMYASETAGRLRRVDSFGTADAAKLDAEDYLIQKSARALAALLPSPHGVSVRERLAIGDAYLFTHTETLDVAGHERRLRHVWDLGNKALIDAARRCK